jgi:ornithine carbamoyltransferase
VTTIAEHSKVPVINGLTDYSHPCQVLADMQTFFELRGDIAGKTVTWIGAGNNMCHSYIEAAICLDFTLNIACPVGYEPDAELVARAGEHVRLFATPLAAAQNADLVTTDVWVSMGEEQEKQQREQDFKDYQVSQAVMNQARPDALFMHCLPAHRGEEVTAEVIDGPQSVVFAEAENRLHVQKALLEFLMCC